MSSSDQESKVVVDLAPPAAEDKKDSPVHLTAPSEDLPRKSASTDPQPTDKDAKPAEDGKKLSFFMLLRYATTFDKMLMIIGALGGMVSGASQPVMSLVFGDVMNALILYPYPNSGFTTDQANEYLNSEVRRGVIYLVVIGAVTCIAGYLQMSFWMWAGENQAKRLREKYLESVLRQDIGWFDKTQTGEVTTRLTADIITIQEGISDKVAICFQAGTAFITGFIIAFVKGWRLALVLCAVFPILGGASALMAKSLKARTSQGSDNYANAGAIAQEVFSSIRTVVAFGGQGREILRYFEHLKLAEKQGIRAAMINGATVGFVFMVIFSTYALGFWFGGTLINRGQMNPGEVINVFFAIIIGAFSLGNMAPSLSAIGSALGAAAKIFETIDRVSPIDALSEEGKKLDKVTGRVEFKNIDFHYPQRPDVPILKNFSLTVEAGSTVALVGASGSGKSTIVKLLERFYDTINGQVLVDGVDVKELNVKYLRTQIGIVSQEPVLFDQTVRENILNGLPGGVGSYTKEQLDQMVEKACKTANAWEFISALPKGLDTPVGEAGGMMSGGQKQRISIARAVIRSPTILLLDEATSALDTESERVVQKALDNAAKDRTTIVIAHRLSTIKNADLIVVMSEGEIVEQGTHNELLEKKAAYFKLVEAQQLQESGDAEKAAEANVEIATLNAGASVINKQSNSALVLTVEDGTDIAAKAADGDAEFHSKGAVLNDAKARAAKKKEEEAKKKAEEAAILKRKFPWARLLKLNAPEYWMFAVGGLGSTGTGVLFPLFSLIFSSIITVFGIPDVDKRTKEINFWALMFFLLALGSLVANFISITFFGAASERLTRRLRGMCFETILRQEIAFFDEDKSNTGVLCARLAEDAALVQGMTGRNMATILQTFVTMIAGLVIAFVNGWVLTLIILATVPFMGLAGAMQLRALTGFGSKTKELYDDACIIANEGIDQIRTVATLTKEKKFLDAYIANTEEPHRFAVKGALVSAIGFGFSQGVIFFAYGLAFYAGSQLVIAGRSSVEAVLKVMFAVIFTAVSVGQASSFAPNYVKAKLATFSIMDLLDRHSRIDPTSVEGKELEKVGGKAVITNGEFKYPSRPDVPVLNGLSIKASPGQTVALVGPSGCGKSTTIAIMERWYDLDAGQASLDDVEIRDWKVSNLRSHMALVGQEPVLFNVSIRENIMYGSLTGTASQEEIEAAARMANIHDFVTSLPEGYNTVAGSKALSGGQKQRIAIARALIRNPKLLLLDEATSALDSTSEKVVQAALDAAAKGRTTLVIAHRLSTIQTADHIVVVNKGQVVEQGTYQELVKAGGQFAMLVAAQSLGKNA
ncbi:ATP-binding cassette, sub-B (MDR TAP), member 4 [Chytridiales sp. JEL 0842]|nr:ATP-binding cassette, sub-B (MDR TAP), member 4 [Chytridiales sp. JEL 0842]